MAREIKRAFDKNKNEVDVYSVSRAITHEGETLEEFLGRMSEDMKLLFMQEPTPTIRLDINPFISELGSTVSLVNLSWDYSLDVVSQTINSQNIDIGVKTLPLTGVYTSNSSFVLRAITKLGLPLTITKTLEFVNGIYAGKSSYTSYDATLIMSLTKTLSSNHLNKFSTSPGVDEYLYYCCPSRLDTPKFYLNNFPASFIKVKSITFKNSSNYTENYDIWRSENSNLGVCNVFVE